jgi:hypothetical protein
MAFETDYREGFIIHLCWFSGTPSSCGRNLHSSLTKVLQLKWSFWTLRCQVREKEWRVLSQTMWS